MAKLKICGITQLEIAEFCISISVDYIGFVFYKQSPRYISYEDFLRLTNKLLVMRSYAKTKIVGLFVDVDISEIVELTKTGAIDIIQLHGSESSDYIAKVKQRTGLEIIRSVKISDFDDSNQDIFTNHDIDYLLFDSKFQTSSKLFDFESRSSLNFQELRVKKNEKKIDKRWFLAGGITEENIYAARKETLADYYDISSGVEISPGIKSKSKIERLRKITNDF